MKNSKRAYWRYLWNSKPVCCFFKKDTGECCVGMVQTEPIKAPLLTAPNCIITPHMSWGSKEASQRIVDITVAM